MDLRSAAIGVIAGLAGGIIAVALLLLVLRLQRSAAPTPRQRRTREPVTFAAVIGARDAVAALRDIAAWLREPGRDAAHRGAAARGVLLEGPPGCGKTLLARALAGESNAWFVSIGGHELATSPDSHALLGWAPAATPSVIFIDDLDALGLAAPAVVAAIERIEPDQRVVFVGATSDATRVDPALLDAGRFARRLTVALPGPGERAELLAASARSRRLDAALDLDDIARRSAGLTGADLDALVDAAASAAAGAGSPHVTQADLDGALLQNMAETRRFGRLIAADERRRLAVHEAGHAIAAAALGRGRAVKRVSILAHGEALVAPEHDASEALSRSDLLAELTILCAGFAAEELYFDEPSTVCERDLERATSLAEAIAGRYGMSSRIGRARVADPAIAEDAPGDVREEVRRLIDDAGAAATDRLQRCHAPLVDLALQLERDEIVEGTALADLLIRALEAEIAGMDTIPAAAEPGERKALRSAG